MYINGFIVPVPKDKRQVYITVAEKFWTIAHDYGCIEHVEAWEADVKDGQYTDFRKAVDLQDGEEVVFSWMIWPDRETADAAHARMMQDPKMEELFGTGGEMPFDGRRMVIGGFDMVMRKEA